MYKYYKLFKPYGYLSQFTKEHDHHKVLGDLYPFPKDVYPIGRLDKDSEGLLLLSNDKALVDKYLNPKYNKSKEYWVQVEGKPSQLDLDKLSSGVEIKIKPGKYYKTQPCVVEFLQIPEDFPERNPPIRKRKTVPTSWLKIVITEGKNRQVRKMCAKVGFPVLRLIRYRIENLTLFGMNLGNVEVISII